MFTSTELSDAAPANRALRVVLAALMALIPLVSVGALTAAPAGAVTQVSASIDPSDGFPSWYEDAAGTRVVPCLDPADPNCILAGFTPNGPVSFPGNFPGEFFYAIADSDKLATRGCKGTKRGTAFIRIALEGTFATANATPAAGQQIVFARTRIRVSSGLCPNTQYTFVHPFGSTTLTTDSSGAIPATVGTVDVGCVAAPCAFGSPTLAALFGSSGVAGSGFLRWDPSVAPQAPAGYLGDGATLHRIVGGTNGNLFAVQAAPGIDVTGLTTDRFAVSGKIAGSLVAEPSSVDFGGVSAPDSATRTVTVTNLDQADVTLSAPSVGGPEFSVGAGGTCASGNVLKRDQACTVDLTFAPTATLGDRSDTLTLASAGGVRSPLTVALKGTAIEPTGTPVLTQSVTALDFGAVRVRQASAAKTLTLTNEGTAPLHVTDVRLDPAIGAEVNANFRIIGDTCSAGASGTTIGVGGTCALDVQFAPLSNGPHTTNLVLTSNAGSGSAALTGTGTGGLAAVGPVGAYGFPEWYRDDAGTTLGQCIDPADPYCTVLPDATYDPARALVFPDNFPGEFFYQVADAATTVNDPTCATGTGDAKMRTALEASFATGAPVQGDQMTFGRIRFSVKGGGLCPNTDYVFTSPYGADLFSTDGAGALKPAAGTQDIGCVPAAGTPCDWEVALSSRVLSSFVMWDPAQAPLAPAGYLGDAVTFHTIVGAPYVPDGVTPANYFQISRKLDGVEVGRTDQFTIMGKLRGPLEASPSAVDFGTVPTGTTSDPATDLTLTNTGPDALTITDLAVTGPNASNFALASDACTGATLLSTESCLASVTFTPSVSGARVGAVSVTHTGQNNPLTVRLSGVGQADGVPAFTAAPAHVTFGPLHSGTTSEVETVTVSNVGGAAPLEITGVDLVGPEAPQYAIVDTSCLAAGAPVVIPVDGTCTVDVVFAPPALVAGVSQVALRFTDNEPGSPQDVLLNGTAVTTTKVASSLLSPDNGFPMYYGDDTGTRVEPCLDPGGPCVLAGFTPNGPVSFPDNFPGEFFYSIADSDIVSVAPVDGCTATAGTALLRVALEGSTGLVPGDQITFGRIRVKASGLCPNTDYTFVTPYGPRTFTTDGSGAIAANAGTENVGCVAAPCVFADALAAPVAASFPRWNPNVAPQAPAGHLGDPATLHTIVGGTYVPPGSAGAFNGFEVRSGAGDLLGRTDQFLVAGKLAASLHATATALDFGNVSIGVTTDPQTVTLTNPGAPLAIADLATAGADAAEFQVGGSCAVGLTLLTDDTCTVEVRFVPGEPTASKSATVTLTPATGAPVAIDLTGTADLSGAPVATITPTALDFGSVNVGSPSTQDVTIQNTGLGQLTVAAADISGPGSGDYVATNTCTTALSPGGTCVIRVRFTPTAAGSRAASLGITHDAAGSPRTVALTGVGVASTFSVSPTNVKFGKVTRGTTKAGSVTVKNTGTIPFTPTGAQSSNTAFVVASSPNCLGVPLAPGRTCSVNITFQPTAATTYNATLTVFGDASSIPAAVSVALTGTGR